MSSSNSLPIADLRSWAEMSRRSGVILEITPDGIVARRLGMRAFLVAWEELEWAHVPEVLIRAAVEVVR